MTEQMAVEIVRKEKAYMDSHAGKAQSEAFDMAIKALEKQIPKKPKGVDRDICPNCGTFNSIIQKRRNAVGSDTVYCWHCGTAIELRCEDDI